MSEKILDCSIPDPLDEDVFNQRCLLVTKKMKIKDAIELLTENGYSVKKQEVIKEAKKEPFYPIEGFGWNFSIFGGPKWTWQCKKCGHAWKERLLVGIDEQIITCPNCRNRSKMHGLTWN